MNIPLHITPPACIKTLRDIRDCRRADASGTPLEMVKIGPEVPTTWRPVVTEPGERHRVGVYSLRLA